PDNVKLCLDAHWVYRGAGDSQVALFDVVKLYISRIVELHLRQSKNGVWTEAFGDGDIDYARLVKALVAKKLRPLCVLEQAVEAKSPNTLKAGEAHARGARYGCSNSFWRVQTLRSGIAADSCGALARSAGDPPEKASDYQNPLLHPQVRPPGPGGPGGVRPA